MSENIPRVSFSVRKITLVNKDIRSKINLRNGVDDEYAVLSVGKGRDNVEPISFRSEKNKRKFITLMCFDERLFKTLVCNEVYSFTGSVSFGFGNTYLVVEEAFNQIGEKIYLGEDEDYFPGEVPASLR